jgi:H+/Cl- antiporter ClcA
MNRRMMAVAGAAAFTGVISKTTSPILILLEMTGDMEYLSGLLVTLLVANSIAGIYTMSFFDTVLNIRK